MTEARSRREHPVAVIGAGPVGLAAASQLLTRGIEPLVLEAGPDVGSGVSSWEHVRLFSPWAMNVDDAARRLLGATGWDAPPAARYPTGSELLELYLRPLARTPALAPHIHRSRRVVAVTRLGLDKLRGDGRDRAPFELVTATDGVLARHLARAVIDASGTVATPNPLGAGGVPAAGEQELAAHIAYGHPDILGRERDLYAGTRVLVAGSGHSALGALLDLMRLRETHPDTQIHWAVRRRRISDYFGVAGPDQLPQRSQLASRVAERFDELAAYTGFAIRQVGRRGQGIVASDGKHDLPPVDRVVSATGYRPDLSLLRELRVELDPAIESPTELAPLIDPTAHSCASVVLHGADQLRHPEPGLYVVGMKSYGRAPTFLMRTGYEQVRSIAAALAGDRAAARRPASTPGPADGCCRQELSESCRGPAGEGESAPVAAEGISG